MERVIYDKLFFDQMTEGSLSSARVVLPMLFRYAKPTSIVDVGCGRGTWLRAAAECGVQQLLGIDGDYVERDKLLIDERNFRAWNLAERIDIPRRFDLAISLEVGEHLPFSRSETFVADLAGLSDLVLFSAALPYQGGTDHINEQWLEFWGILFRRYDYVPCDLFRRQIWGDKRVEYWYSQNLVLFCKRGLAYSLFPPETIAVDRPLSFPHPLTFLYNLTRYRPLFGQALDLEFQDYRTLLSAYLSGETTLPLLRMLGVTGAKDTVRVDLFPQARTQIVNADEEFESRNRAIQRQSSELADRDAQIRVLHHKQAVLEQELASRDETIRVRDETTRTQENELQIFRTSKLQRLRSTILYEKLSGRKLVKIIYLVTALATPERARLRLRPLVHRLKRMFESATQPGPKIERRRQEKWPEDRPLISVVIPSFNYGRYLEETVDSVLSQTFQDFEIIVTDGGSTDEHTLGVLRSFQKPKTNVYFNGGRHLLGDNRNLGISRARGKYICCLDSDDKLKPTYLEKALFLLETYHYDIVSTSVQCFGDSNLFWQVAARPSLEEITKGNQFSVVAVYVKQMWEKAQGYHDWGLGRDLVAEDWDLWVRMMALGARAINIREALMLYRVHDASLSKQSHVRPWAEQIKEILKFNEKHLKRKNYLLAARRNAAIIQVQDPYLNLVTSYRKEPKKPAVLLALPYTTTGGADTVFLGMAEHLTANGFDLSVVTTMPTETSFGDNTAKYEAITNEVYHLPEFLKEERKWKDFLFYLIEARNMDILLLAGSAYVYGLLPEIRQKFPHLKVVDQLFNEFGHIENNRKYSHYIDVHLVANETIKRMLIDHFREAEDRIRVIVHGIDVENCFNPNNIEVGVVEPGVIPQDKFVVSFLGRFSEEKCPEKFLQMVNLLKEDDNLHFLMVGNGPEFPRIKEQIRELQLDSKIYAPGFVADLRPFLKMSGVVVIPSNIEGIPILLMESLSLGVPVVASSVGGIPSIIRDEFNGFVCQPSDIQGFVRNIRRIARDDGLRKAMKANAREYALRHLGVDKANREYSNLFLELVGAERRQSRAVANTG
jgi:glycosyltransferase involved in cell wall biosynthesis